jgi:protoheme IX farnesyltransferase
MLSKRLSIHGTLVGSISGAAPILAGYVAVSGAFDAGAIIVFAAMFLWQMPEFYSIAIYRMKEYKAAGVPVMSVVKGKEHTRVQILFYTIAFVVSTLLLTPYGYMGYSYLGIMGLLGAYWLYLAVIGFKAGDIDAWARRMFRFSLIILLAFCAMISVGWLLP